MVREINFQCSKTCFNYWNLKTIEMTPGEEWCISKCADKQFKMWDLVEQHIEEIATPEFLSRYTD